MKDFAITPERLANLMKLVSLAKAAGINSEPVPTYRLISYEAGQALMSAVASKGGAR